MDFLALAQLCAPGVAAATLEAIVRTESGFRPLAIGINGGARLQRQPDTAWEAVATARWLMEQGYSIDLGLAQVNSSNLARTGLSLEEAFDPCKNLTAAGRILTWNFLAAKGFVQGEQAALQAALSAYNTGSFSRGLANGYVHKVIANATRAVALAKPVVPAKTLVPIVLGPPAHPIAPTQSKPRLQSPPVRLQRAEPPSMANDASGSHRHAPTVLVY